VPSVAALCTGHPAVPTAETYVAALAPVSAAQRHAFCITARTSALQVTTDSLLGDCMAQKTDCREHSNVLFCVTGGIPFVGFSA